MHANNTQRQPTDEQLRWWCVQDTELPREYYAMDGWMDGWCCIHIYIYAKRWMILLLQMVQISFRSLASNDKYAQYGNQPICAFTLKHTNTFIHILCIFVYI